MALPSISRAGSQCLACSSQIYLYKASIKTLASVSIHRSRSFYSPSSLQLPRKRVNARMGAERDHALTEHGVIGEDIEDALTGQAEKARLPRDKRAIKPAANWQEDTLPIQSAAPRQETIAEIVEQDPEPKEWVSQEPKLDATNKETTEDGTPWYLQVQSTSQPSPDINPLLERQKLPDLPSAPPPLLQPLLTHISTTLGLDSLSLLDLRHLNPPAALGANLLMIIGTARSEKHLHVSADRLCRWLRSEYQMRPYADGLLGRNELKLKMKRKNRRSRTLAAAGLEGWSGVGGGLEKEVDDGIRTGWVCVHLGRVEAGGGNAAAAEDAASDESPEAVVADQAPAFIGFGETEDHVTIVVQMFTEQKRDETDLEGLWTDISERGFRKQKHRESMDLEAERLLDEGLPAPDGTGASSVGYVPPQHLPRRLERAYAA